MEDIEYYYKKARRRVEYARVELLQKYYSDTKNPRIIQTKLPKNVTSLRTYQDEYIIEPGEFLKLRKTDNVEDSFNQGPEPRHTSPELDLISDLNENGYVDSGVSTPVQLLHPRDDNAVVSSHNCACECHSSQSPDLKLPVFPDVPTKKGRFSWFGLAKFRSPNGDQRPQSSRIEILSSSKPDPCAIQMINNDQENVHEAQVKPQMSQKHHSKFSWVSTGDQATPKLPLLRRYSFAEGTRLSSFVSHEQGSAPVWKAVLNEVSLSAARISTGGTGASKQDIGNFSGDFTDSRKKEGLSVQAQHQTRGDYSYDIISMYEYPTGEL